MKTTYYDDCTGEFKIFSTVTGEIVFCDFIKDIRLQNKIIDAVRKTERISNNYTKAKAIRHLEVM